MIALIIFYVHIVAVVAAFAHQYQKEGLGGGLLTVGFFGIIFAVGWSISTLILKLIIADQGFGIWLDRSTLSLVLLTAAEAVFYHYYYRGSDRATPVGTH
ncbi:MAG TPA: hypothetical protein VK470_06585 [Bacteroidota bacterium]|nr:hypothetical protein [Bacteroidota bacterium]